jgi:steroid 5-alpha reductase family enzyme
LAPDHILPELTAIAAIVLLLLFALVWWICVRIGNYGFLDALWSLSTAIVAPIYAALGNGNPTRKWAFAMVGAAWSLRLGSYVLWRVARHHPREDARYRTLREKWPTPARFFLFFELQALIALLFSTPFLLASVDPAPRMTALEIAGLTLAALATAGEFLADWQAQRFKRNTTDENAVNDVGLWRYSRHPNYFFESMVWWGFFLAALPFPHGWLTVVCPILMLYLLLNVTGIPLTEKHSLLSRGDKYRQYQRTTSRFIPWFPKQR